MRTISEENAPEPSTGPGAPGEKPFVAAVKTTAAGKPRRVKLRRVKRFTKKAIKAPAEKTLDPASQVYTDRLNCLPALQLPGAMYPSLPSAAS